MLQSVIFSNSSESYDNEKACAVVKGIFSVATVFKVMEWNNLEQHE